MILNFHRLMWSFPWLIILLCYGVRSLPTRFRQFHRISAGVIPLRVFLSGFKIFNFETDRLHCNRVIESQISVSLLNPISQNQIWDPGISYFKIGEDGMKLWLDLNQRRFLPYLMVMDSSLSVRKKFTISSEFGVLFLPMTTLNDVTVRCNNVSAKASIKYMWRGYWSCLWVLAKVENHIYSWINTAHLVMMSRRRQFSESSLSTFKLCFLIKVMPRAVWSFIRKMIAIFKCMREGLNRRYLLARKSSVWKAGLLPLFHRNCVQFPLFATTVVLDLFLYCVKSL